MSTTSFCHTYLCYCLFASQISIAIQLDNKWTRDELDKGILGETENSTSLPILWLHIHKEFGTWVCKQALANGEQIVSPAINCNWEDFDTHSIYYGAYTRLGDYSLAPAEVSERRVRLFADGHFTFGEIERPLFAEDIRPNDFRHAVLMRHPLRAMDSNLNYEVARDDYPDRSFSLTALKRELGVDPRSTDDGWLDVLLDMLENKQEGELCNDFLWSSWKTLDNFKVRSLVGEAWTVPPGRVNQSHLDIAIERLNKFYAVGVTDESDQIDTDSELFMKVNWNVEASNLVNPKVRDLHLTRGREAKLMTINAFDVLLYEYAKTLAASSSSPISSFISKRHRTSHVITLHE